ncbi:MAG: HAD-IB family hydrolase [Myxococcota bacterium]
MTDRRLVLFDFDGTLTDRDTMLAFARHVRGPYRFWAGMVWLLPLFVGLRLGLVPRTDAKRFFLRHFLGGLHRDALTAEARTFADRVEGYLWPEGRTQLARHRERGDEVAVVSASLDLWLAPFMEARGLRCLCTQADYDEDGIFHGDLASPNCRGPEKVARVREAFDLDDFDTVVAYGDSSGDTELLALADESVYRPFRSGARHDPAKGLRTA